MKSRKQKGLSPYTVRKIRTVYGTILLMCTFATCAIVAITHLEVRRLEHAAQPAPALPEPFPVSVDPRRELITEAPLINTYERVEHMPAAQTELGWLGKVADTIASAAWFQNLAGLRARTLVIRSGQRKEEIADRFGDILHWNESERNAFLALVASSSPAIAEGKYFPDRYMTDKDATPEMAAKLVINQFNAEVRARYTDNVAAYVPLGDALTIASLLEREARDFTDMRKISGIIWNRLFIGMNLQIDATLQYAKGSGPTGPWWPQVAPKDKFIDSAFNTYEHGGLPPAPIANPSLNAIVAALNPVPTDCLFYFHDKNGGFHCAPTYEEHVALLKKYYGRGR